MSKLGFIKDGHKEILNMVPGAYPASRITYNNETVAKALDDLQDMISGEFDATENYNEGDIVILDQ